MTDVRIKTSVYFIKPIGMIGPIKVGCSLVPADRVITLTIWSPFALELIGSVPGTTKDERFLHRCFARSHSHCEWFHPTADLLQAMQNILEKGIPFARANLVEVGQIRTRVRTPESRARMSHSMRAAWVRRKQMLAKAASASVHPVNL
jgi:hypothetical protein